EDKVEKLIFLSAYDKRKFPDALGDMRKAHIFQETFGKVLEDKKMLGDIIDDNPNICKDIITKISHLYDIHSKWTHKEHKPDLVVLAPHYPATANQHHKEVLLVRNEVKLIKERNEQLKFEKNQVKRWQITDEVDALESGV
ncbi:6305_t:CDS:2, partial [Racocetra persica]